MAADPAPEASSAWLATSTPPPVPTMGGGPTFLSMFAPTNDTCAGAQVIPASGPFPYLSTVVDLAGATDGGDPLPPCQANSHLGVWYRFTPDTSANYTVTTCRMRATGNIRSNTVLAVYTSTGGCAGPFTAVTCNDDSSRCPNYPFQSSVMFSATTGTTYYVLIHSVGTVTGNVQIHVAPQPTNDTCASPAPLTLNVPVDANTYPAENEYQLPSGSTCFAGIGQTSNVATGRDVVYSFVAPTTGSYSFRTWTFPYILYPVNSVLYVAGDCPAVSPGVPVTVASCLAAANRTVYQDNPFAEETACVPLAGGQTVYAFVDDGDPTDGGYPFGVEVTRCTYESEPNDTPATASAFACGIEGTLSPGPEDDFYSLGSPPADARLFALSDALASSYFDSGMYVNTPTGTLQCGRNAADYPYGFSAAAVGGTKLLGGPSYLHIKSDQTSWPIEPYRLYSVVEPPLSFAFAESEPNDTFAQANSSPLDYFLGTIASTSDADYYAFSATAGDLIYIGLDSDPYYDGASINGALTLYDAAGGSPLLSVDDNGSSDPATIRAPFDGLLNWTNNTSPSEHIGWRARYTGAYYVRVTGSSGAGQEYALAISRNCLSPPTDLGITQGDAPDPVDVGGDVAYTLSATNGGAGVAMSLEVSDPLPAGTTFRSVSAPAGWSCTTPPVGGTGTVTCRAGTLGPAAAAQISVVARVDYCLGNVVLTNGVSISATTIDPVSANNSSSGTTAVTDPGCDDGDPYTEDLCDPVQGCSHPPVELGSAIEAYKEGTAFVLTWPDPEGPFNVYRGTLPTTGTWDYDQTCFVADVPEPPVVDASEFDPGTGFFYLVSRENAYGESVLGRDSTGAPVPNPLPCP